MSEPKASRFAMRPGTLILLILLVVALAAAGVWFLLQTQHPGRVRLRDLSNEATATVGLAGVFPAEGDDRLANPLGIAWDGELLYVAESDAGRIAILDEFGGRVGVIGLPRAKGAAAVYPSSIAVAGETLAVVDNAGSRVMVIGTGQTEAADVLFVLGSEGTAPGQPTSVHFADGEYFVTDGSDGTVKVYDSAGEHLRTIGADLQPQFSQAGGSVIYDGELYVADSNGGRILIIDPVSGALEGVFPDMYSLPRALASLGPDRLAVLDTFGRSVYITSGPGARVDVIDDTTVPDGAMASPRGMAWISASNRLYVTDAAAGVVLVFNVRGE